MSNNPLHTDGPWFRDEHGRAVILRGVNVAGNSKVPPFVPFTDPSLFDPLVRWGMNAIRLVLIWEAIEPQPGHYDERYLESMERLVTAAGERGIHVVVDMHQDMFSRYLDKGCGDGAPSWAIDPSIPRDEPRNDETCIQWVLGVADKNVQQAFQSFFANVDGVRDRYIAMWVHVAQRFADHPAVVGYDLMNEPIADGQTQIAPLYEDTGAAIRQVDPGAILFIESNVLTSMGIRPSELSPLSLGNYVYAPHFYSAAMALNDVFDASDAAKAFAAIGSTARRLGGVPVLLGEYGMPPHKTQIVRYIDDLYRRLDECFYSGTQWNYTPSWNATDFDGWNKEDFSIADDRGNLRSNFRPRAYPQCVAGHPLRLEVGDSALCLEWENDPAIAAPTVLYVPADTMYRDTAFQVTASPSVEYDFDVAARRLTCTATGGGTKTIEVRPK